VAVRIGSSWTNVLDRSSVDRIARWWTATQTATPGATWATHYERVTRVAARQCRPRFAVGESQSAFPGSVVVWRVGAQASAEPPSPITPDGMCQ
jgi:hypothetical protein